MEASPAFERALRPLGVGEMLDRAVTLCVRNFPLLALVWGAYAVVESVLAYFGSSDQSKMYGALADMLTAQSHGKPVDPDAFSKAFANGAVLNGWTFAHIAAVSLLLPLPIAALIWAISRLYRGEPATFGEAYRVALARFLNVLMYNIIWIGGAIVAYLGFVLLTLVVVFLGAALVSVLHGAGVALITILSILLGLAFLAAALVVSLAYQVGLFTCVLEPRNFAESFTLGLRRIFGGIGWKRSLLFALPYLALGLGFTIVSGAGQLIVYGLARSQIAGLAYTALVSLGSMTFITAFMTIFYYDVRVREEGLDLQLAAEAAT